MSTVDLVDTLINTFVSDEKKSFQKEIFPDLTCNIQYAKNVGKHFVIDMTNKKFDMSLAKWPTKVRNGRNMGLTYGATGFQLIKHITSLNTKEFYLNPDNIIQNVYYKEIEQRIKEVTGAEYVKCLHHLVRCKNPPSYGKGKSDPNYGHAAHNDYSAGNAYKTYKALRPKDDKYKKGRYTVLNVWRNISDINPIQRDHLAMCDARSVHGPDDFLPYDYIAGGFKSESYYANVEGAQLNRYKWYYFPNMMKNEMLIFKQFDSDMTATARYTFHSAIHDKTAPKDAPSRESIEARLVAFFPNHEPNTIPPELHVHPISLTESAVESLFEGIAAESVDLWPENTRQLFAKGIRNTDIETVIIDYVKKGAVYRYHGLGDASEQQIQEVIDVIVGRKNEFKETALRNFIVKTEEDMKQEWMERPKVIVKTVVKGIFDSIKYAIAWPENAKKDMAQQVNDKDIMEVIEYVVKGAAKGGYHGLGDANEEQIKQVIDVICERKDEFNEIVTKNFPLK